MKLRQSLLGDEILLFVIAVLAAQVIGGLVTQMSPLILGGAIAQMISEFWPCRAPTPPK